jgi:hypothetical protein
MLQNPINTYAKATYFPSLPEAKQNIDDTIYNRFPLKAKTEFIGSIKVSSGYDYKSGSYFMGWIDDGFCIELITSFLDSVPADKGSKLRNYALPVSRSMILGTGRGKSPEKPSGSTDKAGATTGIIDTTETANER